jgi:hypothetical protein
MRIFTIENETNNITAHPTAAEAEAVTNVERFRNEPGLAKLAANWPASRLTDIWNSLPGVAPVKKFKDRATAVSRIWKALQSLGEAASTDGALEPTVAEAEVETAVEPDAASLQTEVTGEGAVPTAVAVDESPAVESSTSDAPQTPDVAPVEAPTTKKAARQQKPPTAATNANGPRENSKTAVVLALLRREGGTTLAELMSATGWQKHSVRGFLSGTIGKKMGLTLVSLKAEDGQRTNSIQA